MKPDQKLNRLEYGNKNNVYKNNYDEISIVKYLEIIVSKIEYKKL